jgi:hypothetical protein
MAPTPQSNDAEERRRTERLMILGQLQGEVMVYQPIAVRDISTVGAQVETAFPLQLESLHDVRLALGDYRSGLQFIEPPDRVQEVINRFLDEVRSGRRAEP